MADQNLYILTKDGTPRERAFVLAADSTNPITLPEGVLGDTNQYNIYLVDGAGSYDTRSGDAGYTPRLSAAVPGSAPTGGTWYRGFGTATSGTLTSGKRYEITSFQAGDSFTNLGASANATGVVFTASGTTPTTWTNGSTITEVCADLNYNATESEVQTALNAMASITAAGGVIVDGEAPVWQVIFNNPGSRSNLSGLDASQSLLPDGQVVVSTITTGTSAVKARQSIILARNNLAQQDTLTPITNGWSCSLSFATFPLQQFIGDEVKRTGAYLEFELTDGSGNVQTLAQAPLTFRNQINRPGQLIPAPVSDYYTRTETAANFVQNQYAITGLTGGGATNLDGISTTAITTALAGVRLSGAMKFYRLRAGTDAESSPDIIRPDDYNGATNAKVWELCAVDATNPPWYESLSFSAAGNTDVTPPAGGGPHTAAIVPASGAGTYTRTLAILTANALQGSRVYLRVEMPASANPTVEIRNATSGGTLLRTLAGAATAVTYFVELVYTGAAWREASYAMPAIGANVRFNLGRMEILDDSDGTTWKQLRCDNGAFYSA